MMWHPSDNCVAMPITDQDENVVFYKTEEEARKVADNHHACLAFGYEIFEMGTGA